MNYYVWRRLLFEAGRSSEVHRHKRGNFATKSSCLTCAWGWRDGLRLPLGTLQFVRACYEGIYVGGRAAARPGPLDCPLSWACCFFGALQAALLRRLILCRCG